MSGFEQERWSRVKDLFREASELPQGERRSFLEKSCGDPETLSEVLSLFDCDDGNDGANGYDTPIADALGATAADVISAESARQQETMTGLLLERYRIVRELGHGGMGGVYLAERDDSEFHLRVAVKVVRREMDTEAVLDRFRHERQILANLEHPNIARLLDGGTTPDGLPYFVMEYIEGEHITDYCARHELQPLARLNLFLTVCGAVDYAHRNMVIHRDLKPGNILVTDGAVPKLLDFGIAKLLTPEGTHDAAGAFDQMFTPTYASPEQIRSEPVSAASDVYSLGVLLFEMLTGSLPFCLSGKSAEEAAAIVCNLPTPRPSAVIRADSSSCGHLRGDLDSIVLKALRKEPERRYPSVAQFQADLQRHLDGLPVEASTGGAIYRTGKLLRRRKLAAVSTMLVAASLIGGLITTAWQTRRADTQRALAVERLGRAERADEVSRSAVAAARSAQGRAEQADRDAIAQADLAQRRLTDMLELANQSLFDVHDEIAGLNGSEAVRKKVAANTLDYLNRLKKQAGDDPRLIEVLAEAYKRLGDVQGDPMRPSLGDTDAAIANFRESERLSARLLALEPGEKNLLAWWQASDLLANLLFRTRDGRPEAMAAWQRSLGLMEKQRALNASTELTVQLAVAHDRLADALSDSQPREALRHSLREIALLEPLALAHPEIPDRSGELALAYSLTGRAYRNLFQFPQAGEAFLKGVQIQERVVQTNPTDARLGRNLPIAYAELGNLQFHAYLPNTGDWRGSLETYRKILPLSEALAAASPANATARRDLAQVLMSCGCRAKGPELSAERLGYLDRAQQIAAALIVQDPRATNYRRLMANTLVCLAEHWRGNGDTAKAEATFRQGMVESTAAGGGTSNPALSTDSGLRNGLVALLAAEGRAGEASTLADEGVAETGRVMGLLPDQDTPRLLHVRSWLTLAEALPVGESACRAYRNGRAVWDVFGPAKAGAFPLDRDRIAVDAQLCP